jgi:hypothetical protein
VHLIDADSNSSSRIPAPTAAATTRARRTLGIRITTTGRDDYPKAIDIHGARGWVIATTCFAISRAPAAAQRAGGSRLAGSRDTVVEGNTFVNGQPKS